AGIRIAAIFALVVVGGEAQQRHQMAARGIAHEPDPVRVDAEVGGLGAHELDRRLRVIDRLRIGPLFRQPVLDGEGRDAVPGEIGPPILEGGRAAAAPAAAVDGDHDRGLGEALGRIEVAGELHPVVLDVLDGGPGDDLLGQRRARRQGYRGCHEQMPECHGTTSLFLVSLEQIVATRSATVPRHVRRADIGLAYCARSSYVRRKPMSSGRRFPLPPLPARPMNDLFDQSARRSQARASDRPAGGDRRVIAIRGAREHNLKDIDVEIPRDRLVVFTGLSGSGKSSLAFDTIYAEGQRRYVESLSAYARQFLEMMQKPDVDQIDGLSPAISIEQKTTSRNPRSTVGTVTEIYDYMRLLWARIGVPYSPATGLPIESQTVSQMVDRIMALPEGTRLY